MFYKYAYKTVAKKCNFCNLKRLNNIRSTISYCLYVELAGGNGVKNLIHGFIYQSIFVHQIELFRLSHGRARHINFVKRNYRDVQSDKLKTVNIAEKSLMMTWVYLNKKL